MTPRERNSIRAFLAIDPPGEVRAALASAQRDLKRTLSGSIRWVAPQGIHLTLKFFGNVGEGEVARISTTMIKVVNQRTPLDLTIESIGVFPHLRRPRVLWLGTGGDVLPLDKLVEKTEYALAENGFARETRPFTPHWTLARINETGEVSGLARVIEEHRETVWARFVTDTIVLFRSELTPQGAIYTPLAEYRLGESGYGAA